MLPLILAAAGGYLVGNSLKSQQYARGGGVHPKDFDTMNYSIELKKKIAHEMAQVDSENLGISYQEAFENHLCSESFDLLKYWIEYMGVFDGGEERLKLLNPNFNK